jgi:hypothetical protein
MAQELKDPLPTGGDPLWLRFSDTFEHSFDMTMQLHYYDPRSLGERT